VPARRAFGAGRQVATLVVAAGIAEGHSENGNPRLVVESLAIDREPRAQPVTARSLNDSRVSCTRLPGAWLMINSRAEGEPRTIGRGPSGRCGAQIVQARISVRSRPKAGSAINRSDDVAAHLPENREKNAIRGVQGLASSEIMTNGQ